MFPALRRDGAAARDLPRPATDLERPGDVDSRRRPSDVDVVVDCSQEPSSAAD